VRSTLRTIADAELEDGTTPVVVARRLSPGARVLLTEHRTSWADESGAIDLATGPLLIRALGAPDPPPCPPARFTPAAGAIAEVLLTRAIDGELVVPPVAGLADTVGVSRGATSRALTFFDSQGWTASTGPRRGPTARRELTERGTVLDAWSRWYPGRQDDVVPAHAVIRDAAAWIADVVAALLTDVLDNRGQQLALPGCERATVMNVTGPAPAFRDPIVRRLAFDAPAGTTPAGTPAEVQFANLGGYLLAKSAAVIGRRADRDPYDLTFVIAHNSAGGPLAAARAAHTALPPCREREFIAGFRAALRQLVDPHGAAAQVYAQQRTLDGDPLPSDVLAADAATAAAQCLAEVERPTHAT